jgi:hypothetical protein
MKELDRLTLARELLLRKCQGKRGNSKLSRLVELCLTSPIVSVPFAAKELGVSQQAVTIMLDELSSNLRKLTGRGRYRAWAVMLVSCGLETIEASRLSRGSIALLAEGKPSSPRAEDFKLSKVVKSDNLSSGTAGIR